MMPEWDNKRVEVQQEDDGSLACLHIPTDKNSRSFNCNTTTQSKLTNTTFWIIDYLEDVPTKFSKAKGTKGQTLVKIKEDIDAPDSEAKKFFTGASDILYVLQWLRENNKFPRRCTMRSNGNRYWLE